MKIIKRNPERTSLSTRGAGDTFTDLFSRFFDDDFFPTNLMRSDWNPKVDVYEKDNNVVVKADIPGVEEKDLNVELEGNWLTIKGSKEEEHEEKGIDFHRIERSSGSFSRTITLPENIKADKIDADYKKGVLTITIPESPEAEAKKINVKVS